MTFDECVIAIENANATLKTFIDEEGIIEILFIAPLNQSDENLDAWVKHYLEFQKYLLPTQFHEYGIMYATRQGSQTRTFRWFFEDYPEFRD